MTRKDMTKEFLRLCATGKVREAYERFVAHDFRHHNPYCRGDGDSLRKGMEEAAAKFPSTRIETKHVFEEGDRVAVHSCVQHAPSEPDIAVVHIFRFEGERIAELWDVGMQAPKDSPNQYGLF
jgi:predicted SnoaL-like aldol condensation-catalyzing enzyme